MNDDDKPKKDQGDELEEAYRGTGGQTEAETNPETSALAEDGGGDTLNIDAVQKAMFGKEPEDGEELNSDDH